MVHNPPIPEDDLPWWLADIAVNPATAPGYWFTQGWRDPQEGIFTPKVIDPLYQANYDEGFAMGLHVWKMTHLPTL